MTDMVCNYLTSRVSSARAWVPASRCKGRQCCHTAGTEDELRSPQRSVREHAALPVAQARHTRKSTEHEGGQVWGASHLDVAVSSSLLRPNHEHKKAGAEE